MEGAFFVPGDRLRRSTIGAVKDDAERSDLRLLG